MTRDWNEGRAQFADMHEVTDGRTTGPSIDLDPNWDHLTKLRWHAAWVEHKTGIGIYVHPGGYSIDGVDVPDYYGMNVGRSSLGGRPYNGCWTLLNGVLIGAEEVRR